MSDTVTTLDYAGNPMRTLPLSEIKFDVASQKWFYPEIGQLDVTPFLTTPQKRGFAGFDEDAYTQQLLKLSDARLTLQNGVAPVYDTRGTAEIFGDRMVNEMALGDGSFFKTYLRYGLAIGGLILLYVFREPILALFKK